MMSSVVNELARLLVREVLVFDALIQRVLTFDNPASGLKPSDIPALTQRPVEMPRARKGCVIGLDQSSTFFNSTLPLGTEDLGGHKYGGPPGLGVSDDPIGHIYTAYGGIIDIGHARDHADLTRYLAIQVLQGFRSGGTIDLGDDKELFLRPATGRRVVTIKPQGRDPSLVQVALIAAQVSFLVAVWHEIATYRTWQDYSCFSPEDNYSNLLGAYLGYRACTTAGRPYDDVVTTELFDVLSDTLHALSKRTSRQVIRFLENRWYTYDVDGRVDPKSGLIIFLRLLRRHFDAGVLRTAAPGGAPPTRTSNEARVVPWLVTTMWGHLPDEVKRAPWMAPNASPVSIEIRGTDEHGTSLESYYDFRIVGAANADTTLFKDLLDGGDLRSQQFGAAAARIRRALESQDPNVGDPAAD